MMRQLGGSFGISLFNTYEERRSAVHRVDLISNITNTDPLVMERITYTTHYFQSKGFTYFDSHAKALGLIDAEVTRQTSILSYLDAYYLLAVVFVLAMPLLFLMRGKKKLPAGTTISDH